MIWDLALLIVKNADIKQEFKRAEVLVSVMGHSLDSFNIINGKDPGPHQFISKNATRNMILI
jgi:hypothetical protein